ncbi:uncharacterized protein AUP68_06424 [Ilyonectria robusta]
MARESIEELANEVASLKTRADSCDHLVKQLIELLPRPRTRKSQQSRGGNSAGGQTEYQFDVHGVLEELIAQISPLQRDIGILESRIRLQQQASGAGASPSQIKVRTPLPSEPRIEERSENGRANENGCEEDNDEEDNDVEDNDAEDIEAETENEAEEDIEAEDIEAEESDAEESDAEESDAEESDVGTSDAETSDTIPTEQGSADHFALTFDQLGKDMPETLHQLSERPGFEGKFRLPWILRDTLDINIKEQLIPEEHPDIQFIQFKARQDGGMNIYRDDPQKGKKFEWPDFSEVGELPTESEAVEKLARVIRNPPESVSYFNGIMKSELYDRCPLYSGEVLANIEALTHANQIYTHLGKGGSATAMHNEDSNLRSVNVCLKGARLVIKVKMKHTKKFEDWVRANWECKACPQFVRHLNIFFGPEQLQTAGIEFEASIQGPGEGFTTEPYQYHEVINLWSSLAISINHLAPSEEPTFYNADKPLEVCDECGFKNLYGREGFYVKWVDSDIPPPGSDDGSDDSDAAADSPGQKRMASQHGSRKRRKTTHKRDWADAVPARRSQRTAGQLTHPRGVSEEVDKQAERRNKMEEHLEQSRFVVTPVLNEGETMADDVVRLASAILSKDAIKQLITAVKHSTRSPKEWVRKPLNQLELNDGNPAYMSIARRSKQMNETEERTDYSKITNRHDQLQFAKDCQTLRDERNVNRLPSDIVDDICKMSSSTRQQVQDRNKEGAKWRSVCGKYGSGLLALIPCCRISLSPFDVSSGDYTALVQGKDNGRLRRFHELLDSNYVRSICAVAEAWLKAVDEGKQFGIDIVGSDVDWDNLREDEILEQLESFRPVDSSG